MVPTHVPPRSKNESPRRGRYGAAQRIASEQTAESSVAVLHLPDDAMKGRIIGREGRNIRTFEAVTGVNLLIDDTPEAVLLSSFDPVRREVARITLQALVDDGRIQPSRIEEVYERSRLEVDARCLRAAEDALVELGLGDMHPDLVALLGRLRYRTSYGQNVLGHLVEAAHLAGIMAAELRLPVEHAKRCALLHDVGKALTHEVEGSHAIIGAEVARRYGEHEDVVHAIEAHHNEVDGHDVPVPHFGVVLDWDRFHTLAAQLRGHGVKFVIEPYIRFAGQVGEQATMFFHDPAGNALEFKSFRDRSQLFAK